MSDVTTAKPQEKESANPDWYNPRYSWFVVIILMTAYTLSFIDRQIINILVGPIKADLGLTDLQISLLMGPAFGVFYILLGLPLGRLADRTSRRNMIAVGIFFWSIMTVSCGMAKNFGQLFMARIGVGVGEATLGPCSFSMISDYFPKNKLGRALSTYNMGIYLGSGLAFLLGGAVVGWVASSGGLTLPVIGEVAPWQAAFIIVGLPGLLYSLVMLVVKEPERRGRSTEAGHASWGDVFKQIASNKAFYIPMGIGFGLHALVGYGSTSWIVAFFIRTHEWTRPEAATIYGIILLTVSTFGIFTGGWLGEKLNKMGHVDGKLKAAIIGGTLTIPFGVAFPLVASDQLAVVLLSFAAYFLAFPYGVAAASIQLVTPNEMRGLISALYLFTINIIGLVFGPPAGAFFNDIVKKNIALLCYGLATVKAIAAPISMGLIVYALRPFRKGLEDAKKWQAE